MDVMLCLTLSLNKIHCVINDCQRLACVFDIIQQEACFLSSQAWSRWKVRVVLSLVRLLLAHMFGISSLNTSINRQALFTRCCLPYGCLLFFLHYLYHEDLFPGPFSKPIYYFPLWKININSSFKHQSLEFSRLRCFILKKIKVQQTSADSCNCRNTGSGTVSIRSPCYG